MRANVTSLSMGGSKGQKIGFIPEQQNLSIEDGGNDMPLSLGGSKDWLYFGKEEYNLFELSLCGDMIFGSTNLVGYPLAFIACI